jgi:hypothetical protein
MAFYEEPLLSRLLRLYAPQLSDGEFRQLTHEISDIGEAVFEDTRFDAYLDVKHYYRPAVRRVLRREIKRRGLNNEILRYSYASGQHKRKNGPITGRTPKAGSNRETVETTG